jgi:ABC-2 type transport system permease protein
LYCYIHYFRVIVIDGNIPSVEFHLLCAFYAIVSLLICMWFYKKYNHQFVYYL